MLLERSTSEADHLISNNLSLLNSFIRLKAGSTDDKDLKHVLLDVAGRVDMVGRLHRILASMTSEDVKITRLLEEVCEAMRSVAGDCKLRITVECPEAATLRPEAALQLGLLTTELLSNSAKYAHPTGLPTNVRIILAEERGGALSLSFEDDGIGFPEDFDPAQSDSLGMKIIWSASQKLHGQCEWRDLGVGLQLVCRFRP